MSDVLPLPIFPWPMSEERTALVREAYNQTGTKISVLPCEAVPGSPGRVLAFGEIPSWICESVLIRPENTENVASIRGALDFLLHAPAGAEGSFTHEMWMQAMFGAGTRLIAEEIYPNPADATNPYAVHLG